MAASTYFAQVQQLYIAYFGRPADTTGQAFWASAIDAANGNIAAVQAGFSSSAESQALYGNKSNIDKVTSIYVNTFGRQPDAAGLAFWVNQLETGKMTQAQAAWTIQQSAGPIDAAVVQAKLVAAQAFTAQIDTAAEIQGYQGAAAADSARAFLATVTSTATGLTAVAGAATAVATAVAVGGNAGATFTLTNGIDNLTGDSGNNTFIGDATATSAADQINGGAGTDTFKLYAGVATSVTLPQLSNVENLYVNGGVIATANVAGVAGLTSVEFDAQGTNLALTLTGAQTAKFSNNNGALRTETVIYGATDAAASVVLNGVGKVGAAATLDVQGAALTTLNLTSNSTGTAANNISLTNSAGTKLATLNISGDKAITVAETLVGLKTINASTATGNVTIDQSAIGADNQLTFTGGAGNDKVIFKANYLTAGTTGDVLDGGAGIDTLVINDTAPVYAAINAAKNFEVLGLNTTGATVDASQITNGINQFAVGSGNLTETFTNTLSTSKFTIDNTAGNAGVVSIANKVGDNSTSITIDNQSGATKVLGTLTLTGANSVALASTGNAGSINTITTLNNADNSSITVTGSSDLTLALKAAAVGSKVDGSAATGVLNLTGNATKFAAGSSLGDTLIGGSKADVLKASVNGGTLTGNGGNDTFDVSVATGAITSATAGIVAITDFTKGDLIQFGTSVVGSAIAKVDISTSASVAAALTALSSSTTAGAVNWGVFGGNTYVVQNDGTAPFAAGDVVVKLAGTVDLSTSLLNGTTHALTFA